MLPNIRQFATMKRYYFDLRDGDALAPDEEGLDLSGIEAAQVEAAGFLVDAAKNAVLGSQYQAGRSRPLRGAELG